MRGQGYASALLRDAESLAREAGCVEVKLDSYEFQAKPFCEKHTFSVFGVLGGFAANTRAY